MPATPLETRVFIVNTGELPTLHARRIEAAYYATEGAFTTFKDANHRAVYTVRNDHLVAVELAHGADPLIAGFVELAAKARRDGNATGRIGREVSETPDGMIHEFEFDVTIGTLEGVEASRSTAAPVEVTVQGNVLTEADLARTVTSNRYRG